MRRRRSFARLPWCAPTALLAEPLAEVMGDALGHPARVDEDERRPVLGDERGEPVVDLAPLLVRRDGLQIGARHLDREIEVARGARRRRSAHGRALTRRGSAPPPRWGAPWPTGRCAAGARSASASRRASESARWLPRLSRISAWSSSTMTVRTPAEERAAPLGGEHQVERLRRRDEDVRDASQDRGAGRGRRVARAEGRADRGRRRGPSSLARASRMPARGASRLRWTSLLSALSGET